MILMEIKKQPKGYIYPKEISNNSNNNNIKKRNSKNKDKHLKNDMVEKEYKCFIIENNNLNF